MTAWEKRLQDHLEKKIQDLEERSRRSAAEIQESRHNLEATLAVIRQETAFSLSDFDVVAQWQTMPAWPERLLSFFVTPAELEPLLGDLEENFHRALGLHGEAHARKCLRAQVLRSILPVIWSGATQVGDAVSRWFWRST